MLLANPKSDIYKHSRSNRILYNGSVKMPFKNFFCLAFMFCCVNGLCYEYHVPTPSITAYKPRGLSVSITSDIGVNLVIFYISVNRDVTDETADFKQYVVEEINGKWIFDNLNVKVKNHDVIYYKIFVQRYERGYVYSGTPYIVTERYKRPTYQVVQTRNRIDGCYDTLDSEMSSTTVEPPTPISSSTIPPSTTTTAYNNCTSNLNTILNLLFDAQTKLENIKSDLEAMKQIALTQPLYLHLSGPVVETGEPKQVVEFVLYEKLNKRQSVKSATKNGSTITFELFSFDQKLDILKRAKQYLKDSQRIIITP